MRINKKIYLWQILIAATAITFTCLFLKEHKTSAQSALTAGGLTFLPVTQIGDNLLLNNSFESLDANGRPQNWTGSSALSADSTVSRTGSISYRMKDAPTYLYAESGRQSISLKKGVYRISGWIKTENLAATQGDGVRLCLRAGSHPWSAGQGCTSIIKGTTDWVYLEAKSISITQDIVTNFTFEAVNEPDGTAWLEDVKLREELAQPLDVFLLYPNYRGFLFDDQSQILRFDVTVNPPSGTSLSSYRIDGLVVDEASGATLINKNFSAASNFVADFNGSSLSLNRTYLVKFRLVRLSDGVSIFEYPSYRISKISGSQRTQMTISFDQYNRFLIRGNPTFILGVYDSGLGFTTSEAAWETTFVTQRRLFELPINFYLNYWYGGAPSNSMIPMMNVLNRSGILYLQTGNCFSLTYDQSLFLILTSDSYVTALGGHPGLAGFYLADECYPELVAQVFPNHQRLKSLDPDGMNLGVFDRPGNLFFWRDSVDVLGTNPYPLYGAEPADGYRFSQVADWARTTLQATKQSRPTLQVLQFFRFTSLGRWPTKDELRNMSYMAITEGANGLFYWSLGVNALAWICDGRDAYYSPSGSTSWCQAKIDNFNNLKAVIQELNSLQPALSSLDRPDLLLSNSNPSVYTRVKFADNKGYLVAYNYTKATTSATFTWAQTPTSVLVYNESRTLPLQGPSFTDTFGPYQAHVYVIDTTGVSDAIPPAAPTGVKVE